jgi:hypothetical protein
MQEIDLHVSSYLMCLLHNLLSFEDDANIDCLL